MISDESVLRQIRINSHELLTSLVEVISSAKVATLNLVVVGFLRGKITALCLNSP